MCGDGGGRERMRQGWLGMLACAGGLLAAGVAHAAHPLISEDTFTQGTGNTELELGTSFLRVDGGHVSELDPQLSYGVRDEIDVILRPSFFRLSGSLAADAGRRGGVGSTALDVKWRIARDGAVSVGTRFGVDLPTAQHGLGPQRGGGWHALAMATYDAPDTLATGNVAYTRLSGEDAEVRRNLWRISAAFVRNVHPAVRLLVDAAVFRPDQRTATTWPAVALVGAIFRVPPGIDVDVGCQLRLNDAAPASVWLAGMTLRW
jgi:hypothetical protein